MYFFMTHQLIRLPLVHGNLGAAVTTLQILSVLFCYANEVKEETCTPYSKFAESKDGKVKLIPSRIGMLMLYTPALMISYAPQFQFSNMPSNLSGLLCFLHFLKRDLEVLFVHSYSGGIPLGTAICISIYYSLNTLLVCYASSPAPSKMCRFLGIGKHVLHQNQR
jgi:hypothetical protein